MNQIKPHHLWIGHAGDGRDIRKCHAHKIRAIVQLAMEEPPIKASRENIFLRFPLLDGSGNAADLLTLAIDAVADLIEKRIPTLVCCGGGMSRSPAIAAAALAITTRSDFEDCLTNVLESQPADVSTSLLEEVRAVLKVMG